jgi:uncharacterized protein YndB with AHSA1/START domain
MTSIMMQEPESFIVGAREPDDATMTRKEVTMNQEFIAKTSIAINASRRVVWEALTRPEAIKEYMFGARVDSEWREGSAISWTGQWQGKSYQDKGTILHIRPAQRLQYSHYSPLSGLPDEPQHYHTVTIDLVETGTGTEVRLAQDHNATEDARAHSEKNWKMMLEGLKRFVEK